MYDGKGYAEFKNDVAEAIVEELAPVQEKVKALLGDKKALEEIYKKGCRKSKLCRNENS